MSDFTTGTFSNFVEGKGDMTIVCLTNNGWEQEGEDSVHKAKGAYVARLLFTDEVADTYNELFGLEYDCCYEDERDVAHEVEGWIFDRQRLGYSDPCDAPEPGDPEWDETYKPIVKEILDEMPWRECVVIDCI